MSDRPELVQAILAAITATSGESRAAVAEVGAAVAEVRVEITRVRTDVMDRIDRSQDTVTTMRDEGAVNFGVAERV